MNAQLKPAEDYAFPVVTATALTAEEFDAFRKQLQYHDWYYSWSDDNGMYNRGADQELAINAMTRLDPLLLAMAAAYHDCMFCKRTGFSKPGPTYDELNAWLDGCHEFFFASEIDANT
ncbi:MAG TPA: hypothetical protein PKZ27_03115 [Rhodocyclaceae bacterium]|nr:hypothetical protein [Rhodocyclaceae bacterium]